MTVRDYVIRPGRDNPRADAYRRAGTGWFGEVSRISGGDAPAWHRVEGQPLDRADLRAALLGWR